MAEGKRAKTSPTTRGPPLSKPRLRSISIFLPEFPPSARRLFHFVGTGGLSNIEQIIVIQLAEVQPDGTLALDIGPRAPQRLAVNILDGDEIFELSHVKGSPFTAGGETIAVTALLRSLDETPSR